MSTVCGGGRERRVELLAQPLALCVQVAGLLTAGLGVLGRGENGTGHYDAAVRDGHHGGGESGMRGGEPTRNR